jgi:hypothetical protein
MGGSGKTAGFGARGELPPFYSIRISFSGYISIKIYT